MKLSIFKRKNDKSFQELTQEVSPAQQMISSASPSPSFPAQQQPTPKSSLLKKTISLKTALLISLTSAILFSGISTLSSWYLLRSTEEEASILESREIISSEGNIFNRIASEVGRSVVSIVVAGSNGQSAAGTGVVINTEGLILTNKHVIPASTNQINVVDYSNTTYSATVIGRDATNDIAFIRVSDLPASVPPAKLGDSSKVKVGDKVLAIGNALGEFQNTVTSGIVSGIGRPIEVSDEDGNNYESLFNLIQTDAAINPGNSGGPLVNIEGEVIGINTAIVQDAQSLGFSIPINDAKALISQVELTGNLGEKAYLGVRFINLTQNIARDLGLSVNEGAPIYDSTGRSIEPGSPAAAANLRQFDVILQVDQVKLTRSNSLTSTLGNFKPGDTITLQILRANQTIQVPITLGSTPNN